MSSLARTVPESRISLAFFEFVNEILDGRLKDYVIFAGGADKILHFGSKTTREIVFDFSFAQGQHEVRLLRPTTDDELYMHGGGAWVPLASQTWRIYHFDDTGFSSPMRKTAKVDDNRMLRPDGSNLPAFLYLLREKHKASYNLIISHRATGSPVLRGFPSRSAAA